MTESRSISIFKRKENKSIVIAVASEDNKTPEGMGIAMRDQGTWELAIGTLQESQAKFI